MSSLRPPITGKTADLIRNPTKLENHVSSNTLNIKNKTIDGADFDNRNLQNLLISNSTLKQYWHRNGSLSNSSFQGVDFEVGSFSKSTLTNVTFENADLTDVGFIGANFIDTTFKNCKLVGNKLLGIKGKIIFIDSDLDSVDFHEARVAITLINSKVHSTFNPRIQTFTNLQAGASIDMTDTTLTDVQVGGTLTHFKASGGEIIETGIGDTIKEIVFDGVKLEMSIGGSVDTLTATNSEIIRLGLGDMKINHLIVEDCLPSSLLSLIDAKIADLTVTNCKIDTFKPWNMTTNQMYISDSQFQNTIMSDSKINQLTLKNVTFENGKFDNAMAKETELSGIKLGGGEFNMTGSNIPLQ